MTLVVQKARSASADRPLRIGALAAQTGVSVEALRYYEQRNLLRPAGRGAGGYREYPAGSTAIVRLIKRAQSLGFTLAEVEDLIRLREGAWSGDAPAKLRDAAVAKVDDIDRRVRELTALRGALAKLVTACDTACAVDAPGIAGAYPCPLIEAFDTEYEDASVDRHDPPVPGGRVKTRRNSPARSNPPSKQRNR